LDQRRLPESLEYLQCRTEEEVAEAIREMAIRGAPAIGLAAAYGMALAAARLPEALSLAERRAALQKASALLGETRPTAVNLFWALSRCREVWEKAPTAAALLTLAQSLHDEERASNAKIGERASSYIEHGMGILTHCNAGALATGGGMGTALAPLFAAKAQGKSFHVYVDETRPRLQGARLTAWELSQAQVPHTLICDGAAASLMARGKIQLCIVGADRIAANGDVANKIGTYSVAVAAQHHRIPLLVAAPVSTFDASLPDGLHIPIEERAAAEVTDWGEGRTCPASTSVYNPAFDVTPAKLVFALITERGVVSPVTADAVAAMLASTPR
jgi:methylthioribose-1-phosphate isomerase